MKQHDSDDSPVAAKLQCFDLAGKALYKKQIIINIIISTMFQFALFMRLTCSTFLGRSHFIRRFLMNQIGHLVTASIIHVEKESIAPPFRLHHQLS